MSSLIRLILVLSLLMQSVPGLTVIRCASAAGGECQVRAHSNGLSRKACPCGCADKDSVFGGDEVMACCCEQPEPEKPAPLPSDSKHEHLQQILAVAQALCGMSPPEPTAAAACWGQSIQTPHRSNNSIQSLLCVWVM